MTNGPPYKPSCQGCSRDQEQAEGMLSLRSGAVPVYLCFGCVDGLKEIVDAARRSDEPIYYRSR